MHKNIATVNEIDHSYSRLVSAEFMEDEKRRHTSEDGESSSPFVKWTSEGSGPTSSAAMRKSRSGSPAQNKPVAASPSQERTLLITDGPPDHSLVLPEHDKSTEPSRSDTPQPRVRKAKHRVLVVSDDSSEETADAAAAKSKNNGKSKKTNAKKPATKEVSNGTKDNGPNDTADAGKTSAPKLKQPSGEGPGVTSEFATWGQMILDGKSGKVPSIWKLKLLRDLEQFRVAWDKYLTAVKMYNMTHILQIKPHPVVSCVDPDLWISISQQLLNDEHITQEGEEPNHEMVKAYILGVSPCEDAGKHAKTNIKAMISAVAFQQGPKGSTNMDRWIGYLTRMRNVLKKVLKNQKQSKQFRTMYADELRKAVQPPRLSRMVLASVLDGIDPQTGKYNPDLLEARKDPTKTMNAIRASAWALDELIRKNVLQDEWEALSKEVCQNHLRGRCKLGNKCPRSHSKANSSKTGTTSKTTKDVPCRNFAKGRCRHGDNCRYSHKKPADGAHANNNKPTTNNPERRCTLQSGPGK